MSKRKITGRRAAALGIAVGLLALTGCQQDGQDHRVQVELVSYKPEAVAAFEKIAERFNETHTGENTFSASYREVAEKIRTLLDYAEPNPMPTATTSPAPPLPGDSRPCTPSAAMPSPRLNPSTRI